MKKIVLLLYGFLGLTGYCQENLIQAKNQEGYISIHQDGNHDRQILEYEYYLAYDLNQILPYSAKDQIELFRHIAEWRDYVYQFPECIANNSFAQTAAGIMFQSEGNFAEAKKFYEYAAKKGNAYAENRLGEMYLLGLGVKKDIKTAKYWLEKAAGKGYYFSELLLGAIYLDFPFTEKYVYFTPVGGLWLSESGIQQVPKSAKANIQAASYWLTAAAKQEAESAFALLEHFDVSIYEGEIKEKKKQKIIAINQPVKGCKVKSHDSEYEYSGKLIIIPENLPERYGAPLYKRFGMVKIGYLYKNAQTGAINSVGSSQWLGLNSKIYLGDKFIPKEKNELNPDGKILSPNYKE